RRIVALGVDAVERVGVRGVGAAAPRNDEVTTRVHGHARTELIERRGCVDTELEPERRARGVVALGIDSITIAILACTIPGNDEVALSVHGDGGIRLRARGVAVDTELGTLRSPARVIPLRINAVAAPILGTRPHDNEIACGVRR